MTLDDADKPRAAETKLLPDPLKGGTPLSARVEAKKTEQIGKVAIRSVFLGSAAVLSGAFVFAFVISPGMRTTVRRKSVIFDVPV